MGGYPIMTGGNSRYIQGRSKMAERSNGIGEKLSSQFLKVLDQISKDEESLLKKVDEKRNELLSKGISEGRLSSELTKRYVHGALLRSTGAGVLSALPVTLPIIGAIPTFILAVSSNILYMFKNEVELCYLVAFSNGSDLRGERLKHRVFWVVGLSNFGEIQKQAQSIGVQVTFKKLVEKLSVASASRGLAHYLHCGGILGIGVGGAKKLVSFFVGAPISGAYGYYSTNGVSKRATEYFAQS